MNLNYDYESKLREYIAHAQRDSGLDNYIFDIVNEQDFLKMSELVPEHIYVVIKYLTTSETLQVTTQPIQILIMCEQNQIQASQIIFSKIVEAHNFEATTENGIFVKQDYRQPVVLSNFNEVSYGYRSILYVSATLLIMENVIDIKNLVIRVEGEDEDEDVEPISVGIAYSMTPNTQPIPPKKIATSVKSVATFSMSLVVPLTSKYKFIEAITEIMAELKSGNTNFLLSFNIGEVYWEELPMKLTGVKIDTAIASVPSIAIGLMM